MKTSRVLQCFPLRCLTPFLCELNRNAAAINKALLGAPPWTFAVPFSSPSAPVRKRCTGHRSLFHRSGLAPPWGEGGRTRDKYHCRDKARVPRGARVCRPGRGDPQCSPLPRRAQRSRQPRLCTAQGAGDRGSARNRIGGCCFVALGLSLQGRRCKAAPGGWSLQKEPG